MITAAPGFERSSLVDADTPGRRPDSGAWERDERDPQGRFGLEEMRSHKMKNLCIGIIAGLIVALILAAIGWLLLKPPSIAIRIDSGKIDLEAAPFEVPIQGTVSRGKGEYLYLVVNDGNAEWIQPSLGYGYDGEFVASAFLGIEDDNESRNKWYVVFAAVCSQEHKKHEHLDRTETIVTSEIIRLYRVH